MNVRVISAGALTRSLPAGEVVIEGDDLTVTSVLDLLVAQYGPGMEHELMRSGRLRDDLALLVNGRNVLSLPERFATRLHDQDEVLIAIMVAGG